MHCLSISTIKHHDTLIEHTFIFNVSSPELASDYTRLHGCIISVYVSDTAIQKVNFSENTNLKVGNHLLKMHVID